MGKIQLTVFIGIIMLSACSSFFQKITGLQEVKKVAIVSVFLNAEKIKKTDEKAISLAGSNHHLLSFDHQALLATAYAQAQTQIKNQLHWQTRTDVRSYESNPGPHDENKRISTDTESLTGVSFIPPATVYAFASGNTPDAKEKHYIRELCHQLQVDAVVMMGITTRQKKKPKITFQNTNRIQPTVSLNMAIINKYGELILHTKDFHEYELSPSHSQSPSSKTEVLNAYQKATSKALESYFYRTAITFKRMGYQLSKANNFVPQEPSVAGKQKSNLEPGSAKAGITNPAHNHKQPINSVVPLSLTSDKADERSDTQDYKEETDKPQNNNPKAQRRSIWLAPEKFLE